MKQLIQGEDGISGLEILLDETICNGQILVDRNLLINAGGVNNYLKVKKKYEFIIRIAFEKPVVFKDINNTEEEELILLPEDESEDLNIYGWKTDCYVTGRYSSILQQSGMLDDVITAIVTEAEENKRYTETVAFLEHMIEKKRMYWNIAEGSCPILVYRGDDICHNVLNVFADSFGEALAQKGKKVIYFDCAQKETSELTQYMYHHFQAIIGMQTYLFSIKMKDGVHYLHEFLYGPKYNFIFDHPVWMMQHMQQNYDDFYILTHDKNYVAFTEKYFAHSAFLFPPAGISGKQSDEKKRIYDLTFIGTYGNYWNEMLLIHKMERSRRFIANEFLMVMRKNPNYTAEESLGIVIKRRKIEVSNDEFLELLYDFRRVIYCVMHYYRDRVVRQLLEAGITLDVFGDSWETCPLNKYSNLICHANVTVEESLTIWEQSKMSLNIMSWHKGGFTERMANIMLAGAVLVTDYTSYLDGKYTNNEMLIFSLSKRHELAENVKKLLYNDNLRNMIAENGKKKTLQNHTWEKRAEQFIDILTERNKNEKSKCDYSLL